MNKFSIDVKSCLLAIQRNRTYILGVRPARTHDLLPRLQSGVPPVPDRQPHPQAYHPERPIRREKGIGCGGIDPALQKHLHLPYGGAPRVFNELDEAGKPSKYPAILKTGEEQETSQSDSNGGQGNADLEQTCTPVLAAGD